MTASSASVAAGGHGVRPVVLIIGALHDR